MSDNDSLRFIFNINSSILKYAAILTNFQKAFDTDRSDLTIDAILKRSDSIYSGIIERIIDINLMAFI